jgi:hypothetical protein
VNCACGAIGLIVAPQGGSAAGELRIPVVEWRGGDIGAGKIAVEAPPSPVNVCPRCEHRACVYVRCLSHAARLGGT